MSAVTVTDIEAIIGDNDTSNRGPCHSIDERGWAYCGAFKSAKGGGSHSNRECKARGHKLCVVCEELWPQLGDDFRVA